MPRVSPILGLSLLFMILLAAVLASGQPTPPRAMYDPGENGPDGLLLLSEWLMEMGYAVETTGERMFAVDSADLLFVYPGREPFSALDVELVVDWVEEGGILVLVNVNDDELSDRFGFTTTAGRSTDQLVQTQPLLPEAGAIITGTHSARRLRLSPDWPGVNLLADDDSPRRSAAAVQRQGQGWVWLLSADFTLTNERLTDNRATAQIVPALLRGMPEGARILFDTYHLFGPSDAQDGIDSLQEWAYATPTGWAALFLLALGFGYLLLHGRRLGPALETVTQGRRREAAEFVTAMAGLQRRAGMRDSIARQQRFRLKQGLGGRWHIPADLPDDEFVARLASADPSIDETHLRTLLARLTNAPDEAGLVQLAQEVELVTLHNSRVS